MRPTFTVGTPRAVGEHDRHLQDDLELVADGVGRERVERLRAVAGLEQERLALGARGERLGERARLAREHERRQRAQLVERRFERASASGQSGCCAAARLPAVGRPAVVRRRRSASTQR